MWKIQLWGVAALDIPVLSKSSLYTKYVCDFFFFFF